MADNISDLDNLPEINFLEDFGITLESLQEEMVADYQDRYEEITGKEQLLYPGNPVRLMLNVIAGEIYQAYEYVSYVFRQNFIKYMDEDVLKNWGATLGFTGNNLKPAKCTLEFRAADILDFDVHIPYGTKVTAGDNVYFQSDDSCTIKAGGLSVQVTATCTDDGNVGNGYMPGQLNIMAEPILNIASVCNIDISAGGSDDYSPEERRELTYMFPSTYSVAGPEDAYVFFVKNFSEDIVSVKVITDDETATVIIYIMLSEGRLPDGDYCKEVLNYLKDLKRYPDTDKIIIRAPEAVPYELSAKYYISSENRDTESMIMKSVEDAGQAFVAGNYESIGCDVNPDVFTEYARVAGAKRLEITSPMYIRTNQEQIAICSGIKLEYGGLEDA
ncbi:MAG: baseplate J/gp47 family protein [Lachnospiraceae bacterium]